MSTILDLFKTSSGNYGSCSIEMSLVIAMFGPERNKNHNKDSHQYSGNVYWIIPT